MSLFLHKRFIIPLNPWFHNFHLQSLNIICADQPRVPKLTTPQLFTACTSIFHNMFQVVFIAHMFSRFNTIRFLKCRLCPWIIFFCETCISLNCQTNLFNDPPINYAGAQLFRKTATLPKWFHVHETTCTSHAGIAECSSRKWGCL